MRSFVILLLALAVLPAAAADPFAKGARDAERSLVDTVPSVPGVGLPRADLAAVKKQLSATPPSELNLRCQGFLGALAQASKLRRDVAALADTQAAIDRLEKALVDEAVAALDEDYSLRERLSLGADKALAMLPKAKDQAVRFIRLLREPSRADAQALADQDAVCRELLERVR